MEPLVSIVLPVYNGARYLNEAIESCVRQTYPHWELVVVDDASTDDTPAIVAEWSRRDARIRVIRNATNQRLPRSLNRGMSEARGDFLTWTSDDNMYRPHALHVMVDYLQRHPEVGLVYSAYTIVDDQGRVARVVPASAPGTLAFYNCVNASFLYRRSVHERVGGYDERMILVEDYDYWLRVKAHFALAPLDQDLYLYRTHGDSLTASHRPEILLKWDDLLSRYLAHRTLFTSEERAVGYLRLALRVRATGRVLRSLTFLAAAVRADASVVFRDFRSDILRLVLGDRAAGVVISRYQRSR